MSTIASRRVKKTRKAWTCDACLQRREAGTACRAFFGSGDRLDKPYWARFCDPPCAAQFEARGMERDE